MTSRAKTELSSAEFLKKRKAISWLEIPQVHLHSTENIIIPTLMEVLDMSEDDAKAWFN